MVLDADVFRRLCRARELLCDPHERSPSIHEVARASGMSPFHFIRVSHTRYAMRIRLTSIMVDDQDKALTFYTDVLGFQKKSDFPVGAYRWITVVAPERDDLQLALEPNANPAAKVFQQAMFQQSIPLAAFEVGDLAAEYARLRARGVVFTIEPTPTGPVSIAVFSDTCGNLIQIYQPEAA